MTRGAQAGLVTSSAGLCLTARIVAISLLLSLIGLATTSLGQPARPQRDRSAETLNTHVPLGQTVAGFQVVAHYTNHLEQVVGLRLTHLGTGLPVHFLWMDTVPQAAIMIRTYPDADHGAAHALEHLLLGKGTTGRALQTLTDMRLGGITAGTAERYTWYHFYTGSGGIAFDEVLARLLEALFRPDFTDAEAQHEVYQIGVATEPHTGQRWLTEQGTVYTEMYSQQGMYDSWYDLLKLVLGPDHPLTFQAGGTPDAIRSLTPQEIRRFHHQHYVLGTNTPVVIVTDRQRSPEQALTGLGRLLTAFRPTESTGTPQTVIASPPRIPPSEHRELRLVPWPSKDVTVPAPILFGWPPVHLPSLEDRLRLEALLAAFSHGPQSILYRRLVDRQTRVIDLGATGMDSMLLPTYDPAWPVMLLWIEGIPGDRLTIERLEELGRHIQAKLHEIASYPDGSGELLALNRQITAYLTARRRTLTVWHTSPPGFGQRRLEATWLEHLELLDQEAPGRRPLDWQAYWPRLEAEIASGMNIWRGLIERVGLLDMPYGTAAIPSPTLLEQRDRERQARLTAARMAVQERYDSADDQEALQKFDADQAAQQSQRSEAIQPMVLPTFTMRPPRTFDDTLSYAQQTIAGVPMVASYVEGAALAEIGLAFDLRDVPRHLYRYLPLLPALLRSTGVQEGEGATPDPAFEEHLQRHLYRLESRYSVAPSASRYELVITASGVGLQEFRAAIEAVQRVTHANALHPDNLPRISDLLQHHLNNERTFTQRPEEEWIETLAQAFRHQDNHLYLSLMAPPTRVHHLQRLAWRLREPLSAEALRDFQAFATRLLASLRSVSGSELPTMLGNIQESGLRGQLVDYWQSQLQAWPPALVWEGLQQLSAEALADLEVGPDRAIQEMRELQALILNRSRLRLWLMGDRRLLRESHPHIEALVQSFPRLEQEMPPVDAAPVVWEHLQRRYPQLTIAYPVYAGYVHEGAATGSAVVTAKGPTYRDLDDTSVTMLLAGKSLAGTGPHTWYKKTWEAGLAYGNGLDVRPREGTILYYADRCPSVRATLAFIRTMAKDGSQPTHPSTVDYALAQIWGFSRTALSPSARAEAMAIDLTEGQTPEQMQRFSQALQRLRADPQLHQHLRNTVPRVMATVTLGPEHQALQSAAQTIFFVIASESQLAELEGDVPGARLPRVWPSDFWLE